MPDAVRRRAAGRGRAPTWRPSSGGRTPPEGGRPAAVALVLLPDDEGRACFVLTRRAARLSAHAGQWALPGGRLDPGETAEEAARRELHEEVGLDLGPDAVLGALDDYPTRSGFVITPVVLWADNPGELTAESRSRSRASIWCRSPTSTCPACRA